MKILTLNMNMFNLDIDKSFDKYFDDICPDIAFVQECRYNKIGNIYNPEWAGNYAGIIDSKIHLSVAVSKKNIISKPNIEPVLHYDYTCIFIDCDGNRFAGVHLPLENENNKNDYKEICFKIKSSDSKIICGDFNACSNNGNQRYMKELLDDDYIDLWQEGLKSGKAYYIDFSGNKIQADVKNKKHLRIRTFVGNTHIDYILAKNGFLLLKEIIIDFRTLAFTDHCGVILEFDIA